MIFDFFCKCVCAVTCVESGDKALEFLGLLNCQSPEVNSDKGHIDDDHHDDDIHGHDDDDGSVIFHSPPSPDDPYHPQEQVSFSHTMYHQINLQIYSLYYIVSYHIISYNSTIETFFFKYYK